jgi:hypothetical protein
METVITLKQGSNRGHKNGIRNAVNGLMCPGCNIQWSIKLPCEWSVRIFEISSSTYLKFHLNSRHEQACCEERRPSPARMCFLASYKKRTSFICNREYTELTTTKWSQIPHTFLQNGGSCFWFNEVVRYWFILRCMKLFWNLVENWVHISQKPHSCSVTKAN